MEDKELQNKLGIILKEIDKVLYYVQQRAKKEVIEKTLNIIEEVFSEGFFNYFHTMYGSDNISLNEKMIDSINKKVKELKERLNSLSEK